ncbi:twin-arginine translocation signal domain-containing protein [Dyadobacter sp.]|uniref:twin-arginine translocation signal domain-containing protein n=1 Tax=Dyadobacter sp. TaxID=1914288 RepID=UPI0032674C53
MKEKDMFNRRNFLRNTATACGGLLTAFAMPAKSLYHSPAGLASPKISFRSTHPIVNVIS